MMKKILLVDDDDTLRVALYRTLSHNGYEVAQAASFSDAIGTMDRSRFDIVLADIILGDKTGIDVLREVKNRKLVSPVILITGVPSLDTASEAVRLGAYDYIPKPVSKETLLRVVSMALNHKDIIDEKEKYRSNMEAIFTSVQDAIVTVDREMRILEVNSACERMCMISRKDIGERLSEKKSCANKCVDALEETIRTGKPVIMSRIECPQNGRSVQVVSLNASPLRNPEGEFLGAVLVVRDETRLDSLEKELNARDRFNMMIGRSEQMQQLYNLVETLSDVDSTVLVSGESGTGKELVADALHHRGRRKSKPLVKVNCSALSENLLESELFGHKKGAFTGAISDKVGRFEAADGGTIFLDEIGDISASIQVKLLRVLQDKEFERVGEISTRKVDVRVVAATNCDLELKVASGTFREDLYYRLKVVKLEVPPLRERIEDVPLLAEHFISKFNSKFNKGIKGLSDDVMKILMDYSWPGNVRELEHAIEHASILSNNDIITIQSMPQDFNGEIQKVKPQKKVTDEAAQILNTLNQVRWNKSKAAKLLGVSRQTLYNKIKEHKIIDG